jgi:predicted membrane chloride channel (bestrophin family)
MKNAYTTTLAGAHVFLEEGLSERLLTLLQSEVYERGEEVEEVLSITTAFKHALHQSPILRNSETTDYVFWHLDTLIQEAINMKKNPQSDLFLYLKAFFAFKDSITGNYSYMKVSVA